MNDFLPDGWEEEEVDQLVTYKRGKRPQRLEFSLFDKSTPYLDIKALETGIIDQYAEIESSNIADESDLLVVWDGSRAGLVGLGQAGAIGSTVMAVRPIVLNKLYFYYFLQSQYQTIQSQRKGVGIPHVDPKVFGKLIVPIAPFYEQQRIVAIIEERIQQVRQSQQQFQKLKEELREYRQDILLSAVSGQLTEDWREENFDIEPAEELLERLIRERVRLHQEQVQKAKREDKTKPKAPKFDTDRTVILADYEIPDSWLWTRLLNVVEISGGVAKGKDLKRQATITLPYLRVANVQDGYFDLSDIKTIEILPEEKEKYLLRKGDILFTEGGDRDKLGRGAIWLAEIAECIHQNHVFKARTLSDFVLPEYISLFTKTEVAKNYFFANATQSINLSSISMNTLGNTPIALPPTEEQREILKRVANQMAAANTLEASYDQAIAEVEVLPRMILAKAFAGELTEQDPDDEPASVLLEHIRTEREVAANIPKPVQKKTRQLSDKLSKNLTMDIVETLKNNNGKMKAIDLWQASKFKENIELFYAALRTEVEINQTVQETKDHQYLELTKR